MLEKYQSLKMTNDKFQMTNKAQNPNVNGFLGLHGLLGLLGLNSLALSIFMKDIKPG